MSTLTNTLRVGCIYRPKRWSGDIHSDNPSGCIDEEKSDKLMGLAADEIDRLERQIETITKGVDYWSYCTDLGMRDSCPEKVEELCDFFLSLHITPYSLRKR